jgi:NAD kinase
MGNLGFLTELNRAELYPALVRALARASTSIEGAGRCSRSSFELQRRPPPLDYRALNDAVVAKTALSRIIELIAHTSTASWCRGFAPTA